MIRGMTSLCLMPVTHSEALQALYLYSPFQMHRSVLGSWRGESGDDIYRLELELHSMRISVRGVN